MENNLAPIYKTTLRNNLDEILINRISATGIEINKKDCQQLQSGNLIKNYPDQIDLAVKIYEKIVDCADIYFGIRSNQMSEALTTSVVKQIMSDFPEITVEDIEYSYERFNPIKTDWRNVTKIEILAPIRKFYLMKIKMLFEIKEIENEEIEKNEGEKNLIDFYESSIKTYKESLEAGEWTGTIFQANIIHRKFRKYFNPEEVEELKNESKKLYNYYQNLNTFLYFAYSEERILANLVVKKAINEKWQIKG